MFDGNKDINSIKGNKKVKCSECGKKIKLHLLCFDHPSGKYFCQDCYKEYLSK